MFSRFIFNLFGALVLFSPSCAWAQPIPRETPQNSALFFPAEALLTNGIPGLTNHSPQLMVMSVASATASGGNVSLVNTQVWVRHFGKPQSQVTSGNAAAVDGMGNLIVIGSSYQDDTGFDWVITKYQPDGTPLWTNYFNGSENQDDGASYICLDAHDNSYVAGNSIGVGIEAQVVLIKYASNGSALWTNHYFGPVTKDDYFTGLAVEPEGNGVLLLKPFDSNPITSVAIRFDSNGHGIWTNFFEKPPSWLSFAGPLAVNSKGETFISGTAYGSDLNQDWATVKFAPEGTPLWTNRFGQAMDAPYTMALDQSGNVLVTGDSLSATSHNYMTVKYSSDGIPIWTNLMIAHLEAQGDGVPFILTDGYDNAFITGRTSDGSLVDAVDFTTLKLNKDGIPIWTNRFWDQSLNRTRLAGVDVDSAGNFYLASYSTGPESTNLNYVTIKYASNGIPLWTNRYDGPVSQADYAFGLAVDAAGGAYVTGQSVNGFNDSQSATVKYSDYIHYQPPTNFVGVDNLSFTVIDRFGNAATSAVSVVVLPPKLRMSLSSATTHDGLHLQVDGAGQGSPVILYSSTNLITWQPLATNEPVLGATWFLDLDATNHPRRFYRAGQQ